MFWNQQNQKEEDEARETVTCESCKCLLYKDDASIVRSSFGINYYCLEHKPRYDIVEYSPTDHTQPAQYFRNRVPCDAKGKITCKTSS